MRCLKPRVAERPTIESLVEETRKGLTNALVNEIGPESRLYFRDREVAEVVPGSMKSPFKNFDAYLKARYRDPDHPIRLRNGTWTKYAEDELGLIEERLRQIRKGRGLEGLNIYQWDNLIEYCRRRFREAGDLERPPQDASPHSRPELAPGGGKPDVPDQTRGEDVTPTAASTRLSGGKSPASSVAVGSHRTTAALRRAKHRRVWGSCHVCPVYGVEKHHFCGDIGCDGNGGFNSVPRDMAREVP
jgi:hypothetical protein